MNKEKEDMLEKLTKIKQTADIDLNNEPGSETSTIQNVYFYGTISLIRKDTGKEDKFELSTVEEYDYDTDEVTTKIYLNGQKADMQQLIRDYDSLNPIRDTIEKIKNENEYESGEKEEKKSLKSYDLNGLESEKEMEEYAKAAGINPKDVKKVLEIKKKDEENKEQEEQQVDEKKVESVNHLQEIKGSTKVNSHETIEQALGMTGVRKFVVIYSEDTEAIARNNDEKNVRNNSRYSMIAVMNDGRAININDKLELSRSEGTNSTEGRIQTNADGTTEKEYHQASIYNIKGKNNAISIENDNLGEIEIYYGAMTRGAYGNDSNQFVGTQLETNNVWPTSREVREQECNRAGQYHADEKVAEANKHFDHGDEEIEDIENADGDENTVEICDTEYIPGTDPEMKWEELSEITGEGIKRLQERFERELERGKTNSNEIVKEIEDDYEISGHEHNHN